MDGRYLDCAYILQDPLGISQGEGLSCLLPGAIMGQEAGKPRAVWQIHSSAISGGGHRTAPKLSLLGLHAVVYVPTIKFRAYDSYFTSLNA